MKKLIIASILIFSICTIIMIPTSNAWIPPTYAFFKILVTGSQTITANNYYANLTFTHGPGISITSNSAARTINFDTTSSPGTGTGTYNKTLANNAVINSGGFNINFLNGTGNGVRLINSNSGKQVNVTISSGTTITPLTCTLNSQLHSVSGGGVFTCAPNNSTGITLDTISNIGHGGSGFYAGNNTNTHFQFRNLTSLRSDLFIINHNSTDVTIDSLIKMPNKNCGTGSFLQVWTNSTGFTCALDNAGTINNINGQAGPAITIKNGQNTNNVKITSGSNIIQIDANNTAYARNIYSNSGTSGGSGSGIYINNTNTTLINLKSIVSRNQFSLVTSNNTNLIINSSVPSSNVVDNYDTTIGDYSTPTNAVASSSCCNYTAGSNFTSNTSSSTGWNGFVMAEELTGMTPGLKYNAIGLLIHTSAGNVRVKVYDTTGTSGRPGTLLQESNSIPVTITGDKYQNFTLNSVGTVPASGKLWAAFETDSGTLSLDIVTVGGFRCMVAHTYGTGPNPYGTCTTNTSNAASIRLINNANIATNTIDGSTSTYWESKSEIHPWIYVDTGSAQILSMDAMFWNSTSTCSQILLQTSTDTTNWNTKRTTNTNLLVNQAWNFERWNLDQSTERYARFYCNDASSKQLSFYELKVLIPSSTTLLLRHGHEFIDSTNATLPLQR